MVYTVRGLDPAPFRSLFDAPVAELAAQNVVRMTVASKPGFPCRVTLKDRELGESVLLLNHCSHDVRNPYRASHAIFIWEGASEPAEYVDAVPPLFASRILSLRGFDREGMMVGAALAQPGGADTAILALLEDRAIVTIHAHHAAHGCFAARIERN